MAVIYDANFVSVGPGTVKGEFETQLYKRMVKAAVKLNKSHQHVRGMTSSVNVLGQMKTELNGLRNLTGEGAPSFIANVLFDGGSNGVFLKSDMQEAVGLAQLDPQHMG